MTKKVVVGMSGGVDSSVAAYILKEQGYHVIGVTMNIWQDEARETVEEHEGCCGVSAVDDARRVADILGIPYYVLNLKDAFREKVIKYFVSEYMSARTPNPCIVCNKYIKWEALLQKALQIGADYIATGHYAKVCEYPETGRLTLKKSRAVDKDQTYVLYNLSQFQLEHTLMPLWEYSKDEVRKIAAQIGLCVADKPDSQEICFVSDNDYGGFIENYIGGEYPGGNFIDSDGKTLGRHKGVVHYTIGQRKGLGAFGRPMYVQRIDAETHDIVLSDNDGLFSSKFFVGDINFMALDSLPPGVITRAECKTRYRHKASLCTIKMCDGYLECCFDVPQRAITPGQAAVFYKDDYIICGGTIRESRIFDI